MSAPYNEVKSPKTRTFNVELTEPEIELLTGAVQLLARHRPEPTTVSMNFTFNGEPLVSQAFVASLLKKLIVAAG